MSKKILKSIMYFYMSCCIYNLWTLRPVQVLYTYSDTCSAVFLVVDHLPWTDKDKIDWYLTHQNEIKTKNPLSEKRWRTYYFIDIGNGFIESKKYTDGPYEDLYCFPDLKKINNCIVKNYSMIVHEYQNNKTRFFVSVFDDADEYILTPDEKILRVFNAYSVNKNHLHQ